MPVEGRKDSWGDATFLLYMFISCKGNVNVIPSRVNPCSSEASTIYLELIIYGSPDGMYTFNRTHTKKKTETY
jgi:hypothetical protein